MTDPTIKTTTTKPASSGKMDVPHALRAATETGSAQAKETLEKMSAVTTEATSLITNSYSTAIKGVEDFNTKALEFAQTNIDAAIGFTEKLSGVKSPSHFIEMSTDHSRKQFETLAEQTKELAELAQKITLATAEPLKTGIAKAFSKAA